MKPQNTHSTPEGTQEEQTMKKNTQGAVKMNDQFQINEAVNYWNEHRSWAWIFSVLDLAYRTEPTDDGGTRFIVHNKYDPQNVYAVAEEYASGTSGEIVILSKRMLGQPNLEGVSMDMNQFFCFFISPEIVLKREIIPFYEMHLRDLAAEDEDDTTEDTTTKKGATTMNAQELEVIDRTDGDADVVRGTVIIHDEVGGHHSIIAYDWDLAEALEDIAGPLPEEYEHLPEEYALAYKMGNQDLSGYEAALGARIEHFEDFLREHSGEWTAPGGRIVKEEPTWRYPEDLTSETPKK